MSDVQQYYINYGTGAGNFHIVGTLEQAQEAADESAAYTQSNIYIQDSEGNDIVTRHWWGCINNNDIEDCDNPIQFGKFGYYGDWQEA